MLNAIFSFKEYTYYYSIILDLHVYYTAHILRVNLLLHLWQFLVQLHILHLDKYGITSLFLIFWTKY